MATKTKPKKPYPTFPMYSHDSGKWAAKICGITRYFGKWSDWELALEEYNWKAPHWAAGRVPPPMLDGLMLDNVAGDFLASRHSRCRSGEIEASTDGDYVLSVEVVLATLMLWPGPIFG